MKCVSCSSEIDPRWKAALARNECPNCGDIIVEEELKNLLTSLRETMDQLSSKYVNELDDWLLSNFNYIKTNSSKLSTFLPEEDKKQIYQELKTEEKDKKFEETKKKTVKIKDADGKIQDVEVEKLVSDEKASEFMKRAEVPLKNNEKKFRNIEERNQYLKSLKQKIENGGSENEVASLTITDQIAAEQDGSDNEYEQLFDVPKNEEVLDSHGEKIPSYVLNMSRKNNNQKKETSLSDIKDKVDASRNNFNSGGGGFGRV